MSDDLFDLQPAFSFSVRLLGLETANDCAFQEVSGLARELNVEEVVSGGENRFKYRLPTQASYSNLVLKRGISYASSPLVTWCQLTLSTGLALPIVPLSLIVSMLDENGDPRLCWCFYKAWPVKWSMSDLQAQENNLLIETLELAYQYSVVLDQRMF